LQYGEYGEPHTVKYVDKDDAALSGTYVVELGPEFKTDHKVTHRWVRVEGHVMEMWAMTKKQDRTVIERDENILLQRAARIYTQNVRKPILDQESGQRAWAAYVEALASPAEWTVKVEKERGRVSIQPIDLVFEADWRETEEHFEQRVLIANRLVELAKRYGLVEKELQVATDRHGPDL